MTYTSIFAAVMAVLQGVPHDGHEYAGAVIRHSDGSYETSVPQRGDESSFRVAIRVDNGSRIVAIFHNHPAGFDSDRPSKQDIDVARSLGVRSYVRIDATDEIKVIR